MLRRYWPVLGLLAILTSSLAAQAPANATAKCKDDSYSTSKSHRGACKGHGGVAEWLTSEKTATATKAETVTCKDGTTSKPGKGACSHHGGVAPENAAATGENAGIKEKGNPPAAVPSPPPPTEAKERAPANAPAGATALCKDGTYSHAQHHRGACSKHGGVDKWLKEVPK